ncbi:hypothetical protein QGN32_20825 [Mycolicibacterium sp. ND9-15]|uniref:hypothetical protein n=1 Tax=Mycolicibacterium sp. ND9-15 TaxID=3042320 RepID=UPI002DD919B9|nr:hypothetical protein [Mycolicibacterium sp. ND9-15]WSE55805.1 hypothetical protein QGN32_20825 [Mycolicibacterium sp. ND9-15]
MVNSASESPCYLAEWYGPKVTRRPLDETVARLGTGISAIRDEGSAVRLLVAMTAHGDEVLYSVFAASSPDIVRRACERAGFPAERVTAGIEARVLPSGP